jgi:hypothetical protein
LQCWKVSSCLRGSVCDWMLSCYRWFVSEFYCFVFAELIAALICFCFSFLDAASAKLLEFNIARICQGGFSSKIPHLVCLISAINLDTESMFRDWWKIIIRLFWS